MQHAARDRRRVADDDQPHHGEPAGRRSRSRRSPGQVDAAGAGSAAAPPARDAGRRRRSRRTETTATPTTVPRRAPTIYGHDHVPGQGDGLPDARGVDRRDGQGAQIADIYVTSAQRGRDAGATAGGGSRSRATAVPSPAAKSNRLDNYVKAEKQ